MPFVADAPGELQASIHAAIGPARARVGFALLAWAPASGAADAAELGPVALPYPQVFLLLAALLLAWLFWRRVSKRREKEAMLLGQIREREARLNLALWGSGDEFWDWNIRDNSLYRLGANQVLGQGSLETMSTDQWRNDSIHPEDLPRVQKLLQEHIVGHTDQYDSEHRILGANGDWIWVRSRGKVVERDESGSPLRMAGTARDVTVIRRAERERRVALEVLRSMSEAVAVIDLQFCFISVNPSFSRITGWSEDEVAGLNSRLLDSSQHGAEFYRRVRDVLERTGHWAGEMWQRRKDNEEFLGWIEMSEVRDSLGLRSHFVAVVNDITD
jgi:PAS domain S-box-containing protein